MLQPFRGEEDGKGVLWGDLVQQGQCLPMIL